MVAVFSEMPVMIENENIYAFVQPAKEIIEEVEQRICIDVYGHVEGAGFLSHTHKLAFFKKSSKRPIFEAGEDDNGKISGNCIRDKAFKLFGKLSTDCLPVFGSRNLSNKGHVGTLSNKARIISSDGVPANKRKSQGDSGQIKRYTGGN